MSFAPRPTRAKAFSLVEVVLAIGIISFALIAMFGLVSASLQSDRASASDTDLASMSRQVVSALRTLPFNSLPASNSYYFNADGTQTNLAAALYECELHLTNDATLPAADFKRAELKFTWPVSSATRPNTNIFQISIANYGS